MSGKELFGILQRAVKDNFDVIIPRWPGLFEKLKGVFFVLRDQCVPEPVQCFT